MIDFPVFQKHFSVLQERFNKEFSVPTLDQWYASLREKLSNEEFIAAVNHAFAEEDFFPSPKRLIELGELHRPREYFTAIEAVKEVAFVDMSSEEQQALLAAIAKAKLVVKNIGNNMTSVGKTLDTTGWSEDPILNAELKSQESRHENF